MTDPYLLNESTVLRNLLDITQQSELNTIESELSSANMMLLYEAGFFDFTTKGIQQIHKALFQDVYEWAGQFRVIDIQKHEKLLAGKSIWYSNVDNIHKDLDKNWKLIHNINWSTLTREEYCKQIAFHFSRIWRVHPFREGNTRTIVMLMTFFVESHGYYFDKELLASAAGYVRNSFVMASIDEYSEYEHLEKILLDAVKTSPVIYTDNDIEDADISVDDFVRGKYITDDYEPINHSVRSPSESPPNYDQTNFHGK